VSTAGSQNADWDGYGDDWEDISDQTLRRDDYTCQRCLRDRGALQAHHIVPRSEGGPDELENLITLCRPCHAVQHPDNEAFDDSRPDATLFPDPKAPECVAKMRLPRHHECERCGDDLPNPRNIIAHRTGTSNNADVHALCKPCAGVVVNQTENAKRRLSAQRKLRLSDLTDRADNAQFNPQLGAHRSVSVRRDAQTPWERMYERVPFWGFVWRLLAFILVVGIIALLFF
jgi:5-methylcytosine-specific restriction endonuclease McrA